MHWPRASLPFSLFTCALLGAFFLVGTLSAQNPQGGLVGTVVDSGGGRVAGASVTLEHREWPFVRVVTTNSAGEFRFDALPAGPYRLKIAARGFAEAEVDVEIAVSSVPTVSVVLKPQALQQVVTIEAGSTLSSQPIETTSSVEKSTISARDLAQLPLAHRSFANIAYLSPMTEPVEPSDPTKARITAVSFAGSSGLNVDLSVDGGDNNDDYIGGFLQNYSTEAMQEFAVRTAQFDADTSRTNGGSVILTTRAGTNQWHGGLALYLRDRAFNARNTLDNPAPNPQQPFSRQDAAGTLGGPLVRNKLWFFSSLEYVRENASVAYSANSLNQFQALAQLASSGMIPGVGAVAVPTSVPVPFRDTLFSTRVDWAQSDQSHWFFRFALDRNSTQNDLVQQATLPSTGAVTHSNYFSFLVSQQRIFGPNWVGAFTLQASGFHHTKDRNSHLGRALAFPFSSTFHTTSGFETFGDNQFITPVTAFPVRRDQQKYQLRYDLTHLWSAHASKLGMNWIHEPVLDGQLANSEETLTVFPHDPSFYLANPSQLAPDFAAGSTTSGCPPQPSLTFCPGGDGHFSQSIRRLGVYAQDSWRLLPSLTINYGLRYDTTFGLFRAEGRGQSQNPSWRTLRTLGIPLAPGIPHDYRGALAPRLGLAYSPGSSGRTVVRAGVGLYFNDLAQSGWVNAFQMVNQPFHGLLAAGEQGAVIDPDYHTPYALQASLGFEHNLGRHWSVGAQYEHQQGVHQYRRYEYVSGFTLPAAAPNVSLFRTDNRSRYDGVSFIVRHSFSSRFDLTAHYTLASASTWGATVGELFDYVNGVADVRNPFGPGDHGPSGEDVRHRLVIAGTLELPGRVEVSTQSQFESARPFTLSTPVDLNNDGLATNDRAVVNGVPTRLDQFRGTPFQQIDLRVSREFRLTERIALRPFAELFNLLNRSNPGNNFVTNVSALSIPQTQLGNVTALCLNAACTATRPVRSLGDLRQPAGALGDFFGPGTTVGMPFAAQLGFRLSF
jgi:hypothetical protein